MLCLLALLIAGPIYGYEYKEPTENELKKSKALISESLSRATEMYKKNKVGEINIDPPAMEKSDFKEYIGKKLKKTDETKLLICISLGQPKSYIKLLLKDARRLKAQVIIRGPYKDLKTTFSLVSELSPDYGILIDPNIFKKYHVKVVPFFILENKKHSVTAKGSVSIKYFLDFVKRTGNNIERLMAKNIEGRNGRD